MPILNIKKKDAKTPAKTAGDVPDELPSIEDAPTGKKETKPQKTEVPDELPNLDTTSLKKENEKKKDEKNFVPDTLPSLPELDLPRIPVTTSVQNQNTAQNPVLDQNQNSYPEYTSSQAPQSSGTTSATTNSGYPIYQSSDETEDGFFSEIRGQLLASDVQKRKQAEKRLSTNAFQGMKDYWLIPKPKKKEEVLINQTQIEQDIVQLLDDLRKEEAEWSILSKQLKELHSQMTEKEKFIQQKSETLKEKVNDLHKLRDLMREFNYWKKAQKKEEN